MKLQFYLEKLFASKEFENFKKENPECYFCSGFVVIDKENTKNNQGNKNKVHIDYFVAEPKKQMFSFQLEGNCEKVPVDQIPEISPEKISDNLDFDFEEVEKIIEDKMESEKINSKVQKILLSLQNRDGKSFLLGTIFISALGMIKVMIDLEKMEITEFEKKSMFDILKRVK